MSSFTVKQASHKKAIDGKHGPMQVISLLLDDGQGQPRQAEWFTKASTPIPEPGSTIDGDVTRGQYGWDFKKAQQSFNGGGQRAPFKEDPLKSVRILRQHSQTAAIALLEMAIGSGILERPQGSEQLFDLLRKTTDWLDKDVETTVANHALSVDDAARKSEQSW